MRPRARTLRLVLRSLLRLYPEKFRQGVGADAVDTHVDRYRAARRRGRGPAALAALVAVADLTCGAMPEWLSSIGELRPVSLRLVLRSLLRRPAQTAVIVLTLALAIGANTAVFTLIDAVLLRPLPVEAPESLVAAYRLRDGSAASAFDPADGGVPFPAFRDLRRDMRQLDDLAAYLDHDVSLDIGGRVSIVQLAAVSGSYFEMLGIRPALGRLISLRDDEAPLSSAVAVVSDGLWAREFARSPNVIGRTIRLGPTAFTVVGVAPPGFRGAHLARSPDVWTPLMMTQGLGLGGMLSGRFSRNLFTTFRGLGWLQLIGRLPPGGSIEAASDDLTRVLRATDPGIGVDGPEPDQPRMAVVPLETGAAFADRGSLVRFVRLLIALVVLVLLLACVNVAHLLLVRGADRTRELGVCAALGAGRRRLVGMLLAESLVLALVAGVVGAGLGVAMMRALSAFQLPGGVPIAALDLSLDPRVLAFALALSAATVLVFGLVPAWRTARVDPVRAFRANVRGAAGATRGAGGLIAVQVAISVVILVAAGLFTRSLRAGLETDLGFEIDRVAAATVELRLHGFRDAEAGAFYERVIDRLEATAGIEAAAVASTVPPAPTLALPLQVGRAAGSDMVSVRRSFVSRGYFETLGIPLVAGRAFGPDDRPGMPLVAMVNESAARMLWPDGRAAGQTVMDFGEREMTVVGIVRDAVVETLTDTGTPMFYYAIGQERVSGKVSVLARAADTARALEAVRRAIADADPGVAVVDAQPLEARMSALLMPQQFGSTLLGLFGLLGTVIAAIGIHATVASVVLRRRSEIGLRMALGATPAAVIGLVVAGAGRAAVLGLVAGTAVAAGATRAVEPFLFRIARTDLVAYAGAAVVLSAVGLIAAWRPARRAARIDPARAIQLD